MGAIEHATEVPAPVSVLIYSSSIIDGQLGCWKLKEIITPHNVSVDAAARIKAPSTAPTTRFWNAVRSAPAAKTCRWVGAMV